MGNNLIMNKTQKSFSIVFSLISLILAVAFGLFLSKYVAIPFLLLALVACIDAIVERK